MQMGMDPLVFGSHPENAISKSLAVLYRAAILGRHVRPFDYALSFENVMSVDYAIRKKKRSILFLDNDLKYKTKSNWIQNLESRKKMEADHLIIPDACLPILSKVGRKGTIHSYPGYKEDIYIADYTPDRSILNIIPFDDYYVLRPEAMSSFYVDSARSLVEDLLARFHESGENVIFLPRDKSDWSIKVGENVFIPENPLNGLDLIHYSKGVLTGSGTMAREAAVMGRKAVSFFPNQILLSVDQDLIEKGCMIHSRDIDEIMEHILTTESSKKMRDSQKVKRDVISLLKGILGE